VKGSSAARDPEAVARLAKQLRFQAEACGWLGSSLYEGLLHRAVDDLEAGGPTWGALRGHEGDPQESALALRLMGAVHRLALEGRLPELAACYRDSDADPAAAWRAFHAALEANLEAVRRGVERPVQTNEVGRCAALLPGFLAVAAETRLPLRLLEVGASAGLNLRWDRYRYVTEGFAWGPADSPLRIDYESLGERRPPTPPLSVASRRGCDAAPVDPGSEEGRLTLLSYVWPDQTERIERMQAALELAQAVPAQVDRAGAASWVREQLAEAVPGEATVVYHSIVIQYLDEAEREAFAEALREAGARAEAEAPLAWLRMEPAGGHADVHLTIWPGGEERHLARAGYHGTPVGLVD
jgi:hypothetical protein